ncbi:all-trans retinoic acid-induced differentiation factor [Astyanax mexicanus]|uniref:All-trans retinoic acid-induced differentiation factor n=1 Tax=Astyanax mexicanus TaxID=7994 RepID=W5LJ31_ASTMX|nr:all-trans retinoic acid-induced differentiation factor [Astyanax mexicanus]
MPAGVSASTLSAVYLFYIFLILSGVYVYSQQSEPQFCRLCDGVVQSGSAVWSACLSAGRIEGRCCIRNSSSSSSADDNGDDEDSIFGLDFSNCSLSRLDDLSEASAAFIIDLSNNPLSNLSDFVFQGFNQLGHLIMPIKLECPGGNTSWDKVEVKGNTRLCEGQKNACNQTGMSWDCPENSLCMPYGPGFFECTCAQNFHGYKCLREGQFPMMEVMAILGGSTVVISALLWVTQRRKAKGI